MARSRWSLAALSICAAAASGCGTETPEPKRETSSALIGATPYPTLNFAFVMVDIGDGVALTQEEADTFMFAGPGNASLKAYLLETSYGMQDVGGDVIGPLSYSLPNCQTNTIETMASTLRTTVGTGYDHYVWYFGTQHQNCSWTGYATPGTPAAPARDVWFNASVSCVVRYHEYQHNFGMQHASRLDCGAVAFANDPDACTHLEFGDSYDPLGGGCYHMNAYKKVSRGWLGGCNGVRVNSSGTFTLLPLEQACDGIQVLQIPMPAPRSFTHPGGDAVLRHYYLELRTRQGFDATMAVAPTVLVHVADDFRSRTEQDLHTWLLDMEPATTTVVNGMNTGDTFTDPAGGVSFTAVSVDDSSATISVTVPGNGASTCLDGATIAPPGPPVCGAGGTGGTGGSGGTSGAGGLGGAGGTAGVGGTGGTSGAAGTGGTSGAAGTGGTSGAGGMTSGGAGGESGGGMGGATAGSSGSAGDAGGGAGGATAGSSGAGGSTAGESGAGGASAGSNGAGGSPSAGGSSNGGAGGASSGGFAGADGLEIIRQDGACICGVPGGAPRRSGTPVLIGLALFTGALLARRRRGAGGAVIALLGCLLLFAPSPARAQSAAKDPRAQTLLKEGKRLMTQKQYAEACAKFESSQRIESRLDTLFQIAACYEAGGRYATARNAYRKALDRARTDKQRARVADAEKRIRSLEQRLAHVKVVVPDSARVPGLDVQLDGAAVTPDAFGVPIPVDPGEHVVEVKSPGKQPTRWTVTAPPNAAVVDVLVPGTSEPKPAAVPPSPTPSPPAPAPATTPPEVAQSAPLAAAPVAAPPPAPAPAVSPEESARRRRTLGFVIGGVGLASAAAGGVFAALTKVKDNEAEGLCTLGPGANRCESAREREDYEAATDSAQTYATISYVTFGVGGAALAAGAVLILTAQPGSKAESPPSATVTPLIAPGLVGVSAGARF